MEFDAAAPAPARAAHAPGAALQILRAAAAALLLALVALGLAWELRLAPTGSGMLALKVLPLAFALAGVLKHRLYTYRWLALLVWLYVLEGLVRATSEGGTAVPLAAAETGLALALFAATTIYIRLRLRPVHRGQGGAETA